MTIPRVTGNDKLVGTQQSSLVYEETDEQRATVEACINSTFGANYRVKRRDPTYYIKNPARVYVETLGNKHYALKKMAGGSYMTKLKKGKNSPEDHLPVPPKFGQTLNRGAMS